MSETIKISCPVLSAKNEYGYKFSKNAFQNIYHQLSDMAEHNMCGEVVHKDNNYLRLDHITHKLVNAKLEDDVIYCEAEVLNTPMGEKIKDAIKVGKPVKMAPKLEVTCNNNDKVIKEAKLVSVEIDI